jgi:diaminopimelate decarboxylase
MSPTGAIWSAFSSSQLEDLAFQHGTPFYLFDADEVRRRAQCVRDAFDGLLQVYFAVKSNPNLGLIRALRSTIDGLDISSVGELDQACLAGYDPGVMSFAGPGKSAMELECSIAQGVGCISVESLRELRLCVDAARRIGRRANVTLRINPLLPNRAFGLKMGGRPVQFGIDEEQLDPVVAEIKSHAEHIEFRGVHIYAGSQGFEPHALAESLRDSLRLARTVEEMMGVPCQVVNLGGGFGVSHTEDGKELDVGAVAREFLPFLQEFRGRQGGPGRVFFELGRYLTADAGLYVCRVLGIKQSRGKSYVVVDGGLHHHLAAAGTFGAALRSNFILRNLSHPHRFPMRCSFAGPSCNPTDLLGIDVEVAEPREGDLIGVLKSGSYGLTASPLLFLGRRTPVELVSCGGSVSVGRKAFDVTAFN